MDLLRLILDDFCGHSHSDIDLSGFSTALIVGKRNGNERISNTVGKSTIFAAIKYVLFNEVEFSKLEKVIRHGCDKCTVSLEFLVGDNIKYKIVRSKSRKTSSDLMLFKWNDGWVDLTQRKSSDTEIDLQKIIKINYKTFCNTVLFSQAEILYGLAALTPTDRKAALKEALQLNTYSNLEKLAKKKTADLLKEIDKSKVILSTIGDPKNDVAKLEQGIKEQEIKITELKQIEKQLQISMTENEIDVEQAKSIYIKLDSQSKTDRQRYDELKISIPTITQSLADIENKILLLISSKVLVEADIDKMSKYNTQFTNIEQTANEIDDKLVNLTNSIDDKKATIKALALHLEELKIPLPKEGICKHCRQEMSIEHRQACQQAIISDIAKSEQEMKILVEEFSVLKEKEKTLAQHKQKALNIKETVRLNIFSITSKNSEMASIIERLEELSTHKSKTGLDMQIMREELATIEARLIAFKAEYKQAENDYKKKNILLKSIIENIDNNRKDLTTIMNQMAVLHDNKNRRQQDLQKLIDLNNIIKQSETSYSLHQDVVQAFGSSGIPALITHTILDDFQIETNALLTQLKPGLQSKFSVQKTKDNGDDKDTLDISYVLEGHEVEYAQLSGAQKLIASLCLKLGLSTVIKKRLDIDIKILLIDEIDQSLDDESLDAFEDTIKRLQNDYKILVITHKKELKERFTTAIVVNQDEDFVSTAKVSNAW